MSILDGQSCEDNWTDLPLHQLLYEWIVKNMSVPTDLSIIVAYISLFLITWYALVWVTRFIITIIWPIFLVVAAIIAFRILQFYEPEEIANIAFQALTIVADTIFDLYPPRTMPVAVRLVEVLTLITLLGILTGISIFVVIAHRISYILLLMIAPLTYVIYGFLYFAEKVLVSTLSGLFGVTTSVSDNMN